MYDTVHTSNYEQIYHEKFVAYDDKVWTTFLLIRLQSKYDFAVNLCSYDNLFLFYITKNILK